MSDPLTEKIIGAAIEVHKELGPGLLEPIYEEALVHEFQSHKIDRWREAHFAMMLRFYNVKRFFSHRGHRDHREPNNLFNPPEQTWKLFIDTLVWIIKLKKEIFTEVKSHIKRLNF